MRWYAKAAEFGHIRAQLKLGEMYYYGIGTEKKPGVAAKWLKQPAEQGYSNAQYLLGLIYSKGEGSDIVKSNSEALYWFKKAAEDYHAEAAYQAGRMYYYGIGEQANPDQAQKYLKIAQEHGHSDARLLLAGMAKKQQKAAAVQPSSQVVPPQRPQSTSPPSASPSATEQLITQASPLTDLQKQAQSGNAGAQFELAEICFYGTGDQRFDIKAALQWYEKAARNGHVESQYKLGMFYYYGEIVTKDLTKARSWFEKAAAQNHGEAKNRIAMLDSEYKNNQPSQTEILMAKSRQGDREAQYQLGLLYPDVA
jgi:TPR repeat protein